MKIMKVIAIGLLIMVLALAGAMVYEKYIVEPRVEAEAAAKAEAEAKVEAEAAAKAEAEAAEAAAKAEVEAAAKAEAEAEKAEAAEAAAKAEAEAEVIPCVDKVTGKKYYATKRGTSSFLAWLRENETVENAVSSIECAKYGNSMVVDHDDPRIVMVEATVNGEKVKRPFTVYDLYFGQKFEVEFCRNGSYLYAYREGTEFTPSTKTDVKFKGLPDGDAFKNWVCPKHQAIYVNRLIFEGYPDAEGYKGIFCTKDGLDPLVLLTIVQVETEDGRYDWCPISCCDRKGGSNGGSGSSGGSGSNGGSSNGGSSNGSGSSKGQSAHSPEGDDKGKHNPDEPATDDSDEKDSNESFKEEQWKDEGSSGTGSSSGSSSEKDSNESFKEENWEAEEEEKTSSNSQHTGDDEEEKTSNSQQKKAEEEEKTSSNSKHSADEKEENTSSNSQQEEETDSDEEFVLETF